MKLRKPRKRVGPRLVAPRRGAWVETGPKIRPCLHGPPSHPAGVRGLKHLGQSWCG